MLTGHHGEQFDGFLHPGIDLTFVKEQEQLGTGGALWNARDHLEDEFILLWGDDYHPIQYAPLVNLHRKASSKLTMTVTTEHHDKNLQHEDGRLVHYAKDGDVPKEFNGYEAGTSIVRKLWLKHSEKKANGRGKRQSIQRYQKTFMPTLTTPNFGIWERLSVSNV